MGFAMSQAAWDNLAIENMREAKVESQCHVVGEEVGWRMQISRFSVD